MPTARQIDFLPLCGRAFASLRGRPGAVVLSLLAAGVSFGQTITITGHVNGTQGKRSPLCYCIDNDQGTVRLSLKRPAWVAGGEVIYPFTAENSLRIKIGNRVWKSDFEDSKARTVIAKRDNDVMAVGVFSRVSAMSVSVSDQNGERANLTLDLYAAGEPIWSVISNDKISRTPLAPGYFTISNRRDRFSLVVDKFDADPQTVTPIGPKPSTETTAAQNAPPPPPSEPPNNSAAAAIKALAAQSTIQPGCNLLLNAALHSAEYRDELLGLYETDRLVFAKRAVDLERILLKLAGAASLVCVTENLVVAMKNQGGSEPNKALQTGGNTISKNTADQLNKRFGKNLLPREWGRALEALKQDNGLPPNFHGAILSNGDFVGDGNNYGSIADYLP